MNVLHVYRTYFPDTQGGAEESIRQMTQSTSALGVNNRVLTLQRVPGENRLEVTGTQVWRARRQFSLQSCDVGFGMVPQFRELQNWCDLVHYHFPWPFADMLELFAGRKPYVVTYHSDIVRQARLGWLYRPLMKHFLNSARRIVATSPDYAASSRVLADYQDKLAVIPLGIDEGSYPSVQPQTLQQVEQQCGRDFFLFVGVFRYYKGLDVLVESLKGAGHRVVIAGTGPEEVALKERISTMGLDNVMLTGWVSDEFKVALFQLCRAVVLPSSMRSEAFGMTLLEGAMFGKPLISASIGTGTSYVNHDGETGLVVEPGSPPALRKAMDYMSDNPAEAVQMGLNARIRYEQHFTGSVVGEGYYALYEQVLSELTQVEKDSLR